MHRILMAFTLLWAAIAAQDAAGGPKPAKPAHTPIAAEAGAAYDDTTLFVRYAPNAKASDKASAHASLNSTVLRSSKLVPGLEHIALAPGMTVEKAVRLLNRLPFVEYAHPNYHIHANQVPPDDQYFTDQWALNNTGQGSVIGAFLPGLVDADIDWLEASALATGSGVVVAVLDTGVDYRHTDIEPNLWKNDAEVNGSPGVDDDGNGYIDDELGWDFANNDPYPLDGSLVSHGTMVSGVIAAVTNNTKGAAGVMPDGKVMALKVIADSGIGLLSDAIEGLEYALDKGVRISNNSYGYSYADLLPEEIAEHNALFDAIQAAQAADHLFIAAAGNDAIDTDVTTHYPSGFALDNIIAVGATDNTDSLAWFSSYGATSVDLAAPGDIIFSVAKLFAGILEDYGWESGTSLAAPHVTGVAGLILELEPSWNYQQIKARILTTTRTVPGLAGTSITGGVLNAFSALDGLPAQDVTIDVLPGDPANAVYPNQSGKLPVTIMGSIDFDATQVDPATVKFGPADTTPTDPVDIADVNPNSPLDATLKFQVANSGIECNDTGVSLSGETYSGDLFEGSDTIDATQCEAGGCHAY